MTPSMYVLPIPATVLAEWRTRGADGLGNDLRAISADGGEPLRCCLVRATAGERIAVASYSPTPAPGPWQEYGPVYVHADECAGREPDAGLPPELRTGPRVLRGYRSDGTLHYGAITVVPDGVDIEQPVRELVERPDVLEVHVRALAEQCFAYAVRAG